MSFHRTNKKKRKKVEVWGGKKREEADVKR